MDSTQEFSAKRWKVRATVEFIWDNDDDEKEFEQYIDDLVAEQGGTPEEHAMRIAKILMLTGKQDGEIETGYYMIDEESNGTL